MRRATKIDLTEDERFVLGELATKDPASDPFALRARIVLAASTGKPTREIAFDLGTVSRTVCRWRTRFVKDRIAGIYAEPGRSGRKAVTRMKHASEILKVTQHVNPPDGRRWSCRGLAAHLGLSPSLVQRVWKAAGINSDWRSHPASPHPFREGDRVLILGGFFCGDQKFAVTEVLSADNENVRDWHIEPLVAISPNVGSDCGAIGVKRQRRMQIDQLLCFLTQVQRRAASNSSLHIIAENLSDLSHHRLRRWLRRSGRFSIHASSAASEYLRDAETELRELLAQRVGRALGTNLQMLSQSHSRQAEASLNGQFDLAGASVASFAASAAS